MSQSKKYRLKDLAAELDCCERQAKRWYKFFNIPPTIPSQPAHKWSEADKNRLVTAYRKHWQQRARLVTRLQARRASGQFLSKSERGLIGNLFSSPKRGKKN